MESLDFCRDLCDKLQEQKIEYVIIAVRKDKKGSHTNDIFFSINKDSAKYVLDSVLPGISEVLQKKSGGEVKKK